MTFRSLKEVSDLNEDHEATMRIYRILGCLAGLLFLCAGALMGQVSQGGLPVSFQKLSLSSIPTVETGPVDVQALLAEDEIEHEQGLPFRFGAPFDVNYNSDNSGTWDDLPDGGRLWRLRIESPGAYSINLLYDYFYMPPGGRMFLYSEDRQMVLGAFTEANNKDQGQFATAPVKGDVTIVEYYEPPEVRGQGSIAIGRIVHGYKDIFNYAGEKGIDGFEDSGPCNNNINCPEGNPWQREKRAVVMIMLSGGTRWCSGTLINNVRKDGTPYILTANHCLGSEATWIIWFNYESPTCENIDGPSDYTITGTTRRAASSTSDFGLVELSLTPPQSYGVYYAGWSNIDTASPSSVSIHHPSGDVKKISFDYDPVTSADYLQATGTTHWRIGSWDDGTTEGGSSGGPLFDPNHRVVGQLHGGYASCTSLTSDWYGKFSLSWTGNGTADSRLRDWLDPDNTGVSTLNGWDPNGGAYIVHVPVSDTRDTINDYEIKCAIVSNVELIAEQLLLHYQTASTWYDVQLQPDGELDGYHGYIPAQSAGTMIYYFLTAEDTLHTADTTAIYSFFVDYSPAIEITPVSISATVPEFDSDTASFIIANTGNGALDYSIKAQQDFVSNPILETLQSSGGLRSASFEYPDEYKYYRPDKGAEDTRVGRVVDKSAGGPDNYGYVWIDSDEGGGPSYSWVDISSVGSTVTLIDDGFAGPVSIGFDFPFYGINYSQIFIGSNGILTFGSGTDDRFNATIPTPETPNNFIAMFWADLDPPQAGEVYYYYDAAEERFIVSFENIRFYYNPGGTGSLTFQVILYPDGRILMQYASLDPGLHPDGLEGTTVGIENSTGGDGLEIVFNAVYLHNQLATMILLPYQWLTLDTFAGTIASNEADTILCTFTTQELAAGIYNGEILVSSNDPDPGDTLKVIPVELTVTPAVYICGDANDDGLVNQADAVFLINYIFKEGAAPLPLCQGYVNGDDLINIGDPVSLIDYLFRDGSPPVEPCCP